MKGRIWGLGTFFSLLSFFGNFCEIHSICIVSLAYSKSFPGGNFFIRPPCSDFRPGLYPKTGINPPSIEFWEQNRDCSRHLAGEIKKYHLKSTWNSVTKRYIYYGFPKSM